MKDLLITKWRTLSVEGGKDDVEGGTGSLTLHVVMSELLNNGCV